jgi:glycosyltransferase involved in cell wall biosynthesis
VLGAGASDRAGRDQLLVSTSRFTEHVAPLLGVGVDDVGEVGRADKVDLLANATSLLNPIGWGKPFGMVMVEALACGTPVVANALRLGAELITDGVTGFVRADLDDPATALRDVGSLDRSRCPQRGSQRFATEGMVAEHVSLYERVIIAHRRERTASAWSSLPS